MASVNQARCLFGLLWRLVFGCCSQETGACVWSNPINPVIYEIIFKLSMGYINKDHLFEIWANQFKVLQSHQSVRAATGAMVSVEESWNIRFHAEYFDNSLGIFTNTACINHDFEGLCHRLQEIIKAWSFCDPEVCWNSLCLFIFINIRRLRRNTWIFAKCDSNPWVCLTKAWIRVSSRSSTRI